MNMKSRGLKCVHEGAFRGPVPKSCELVLIYILYVLHLLCSFFCCHKCGERDGGRQAASAERDKLSAESQLGSKATDCGLLTL